MKPEILRVTTQETTKIKARLDEMQRPSYQSELAKTRIEEAKRALAILREHYRGPVETKLAEANGRADRHAITTFGELEAIADSAESLLERRGVTKRNRIGAVLEYRPAGPRANAYKYRARSTFVRLTRAADGWRLTGVARAEISPKQAELFHVTISGAARDDILRKALSGMTVAPRAEESQAA